ncbi:hypothetical protein CL614_10110 [archaeon]|nr:hypothetical protein [archaeon]
MRVLGIWDGHDAGAALVSGNKILSAINEERLTRRKLEVGFPSKSILSCLTMANLEPKDIGVIAITTSDLAKTITRIFPSLKERYYLLRRRQKTPKTIKQQKAFKYKITEYGSNRLTKNISKKIIRKHLNKLGFKDYKLYIVEHHDAHAATAAFSAPFKKGVAVTLDGVGDGLSGSVNIFENGIERVKSISAKSSFGIFFEHVTNLMNMRELEDEGKVMAISNFAYGQKENPMLSFFKIDGLDVKAKYNVMEMYKQLQKILWSTPSEQFAYMAQSALEQWVVKYFQNVIDETSMNNIAWSGGVASNIKVNRKIRLLPGLKKWFVFPHMGDGGLALGAAMFINNKLTGTSNYTVKDTYFGLEYTDEEIESALKNSEFSYQKETNIEKHIGELIAKGEIIFRFNGKMEFGPRALGNRSILSSATDESVKDALNLRIKKRVWYQPFCPSMLESEAKTFFEDYKSNGNDIDRLMTMGYMTTPKFRDKLLSVINVDGSARPQMLVPKEKTNQSYEKILKNVKKNTGLGIVLNTSLNIHGQPMVCSPRDAVQTLRDSNNKYMAIGNFFVKAGKK